MTTDTRKPQLSVVGAGDASTEVYEAAQEVGRRIAQLGGVVVCGGLGGVMEAACRGAAEAGGSSIANVGGAGGADAAAFVMGWRASMAGAMLICLAAVWVSNLRTDSKEPST